MWKTIILLFLLQWSIAHGQSPCALVHSGAPAAWSGAAISQHRSEGEVYRIPMVVHVVWKQPEENISDSLIEAQIDILNANFAALDPDSVLIRNVFGGRRTAAHIRFEIVQINHVQTSSDFTRNFPKLYWDAVKYAEWGGVEPVSPEQFLNLWICDFKRFSPQGLLTQAGGGYARPPLGLPLWADDTVIPQLRDGVVIDDNTFSLPEFIDLLTHETGHYLGLKHTFPDQASTDCTYNDGMPDTPPVATSSTLCMPDKNSCITPSGSDEPDMWENYMDYAHSCSALFTADQVAFMRAVLEEYRADLYQVVSAQAPANPALLPGIYPNPARDGFYFSEAHLVQSATLFNTTGQVQRVWENPEFCSLQDLPAGMYWVVAKIKGQEGVFKTVLVKG
ncbi:MAG TPA: zinc-dependent metalloprotease [Saprospiraceae bacterium]|nr:zinc-dependent metalloprotease [Saprospiraceae bacterium]